MVPRKNLEGCQEPFSCSWVSALPGEFRWASVSFPICHQLGRDGKGQGGAISVQGLWVYGDQVSEGPSWDWGLG